MPINRITIKSEGSSYMALNIPGTQIYAGRYHHGNIKTAGFIPGGRKDRAIQNQIFKR